MGFRGSFQAVKPLLGAQFERDAFEDALQLTNSFGIDKPLFIITSYLCGGAGVSKTPLSNLCAYTADQNKGITYSITMDKTITAFGSHIDINDSKQNNVFKIKSTVSLSFVQ